MLYDDKCFYSFLFISEIMKLRTTMTMTERERRDTTTFWERGVRVLRVSRSLGQFDKLSAITNNYKQRDNVANMRGREGTV